ncbi:MAG: NFACT family protein [Clostridia bacterium]|nr:NFACT family protein [Clostridia bacterium]
MTMPQDAFTLRYVCKELERLFVGGKISKINQPEKDLLSLLIYTHCGTVKLDIDLSAKYCRVSAGEKNDTPNPKTAPNFCMLLRKHLQNAEITAVKQAGFERVLYFDFKCFSEFEVTDMRLYLEIMGKYSNAVLVKDGIITGALKTASLETGARRVTLSGAIYRLPEKQEKCDPTDFAALEKTFENLSGDAAKFIADNVAGIAYVTAADIVNEYGDNVTAEQVYNYINLPDCRPCIEYRDGVAVDFKARRLGGAKPYKTILEAQADFYTEAVTKKRFADKKRRLLSAVNSAEKKVEKRLAQTYDKLTECDKADEIKLKGELITANIYAVERGSSVFETVNYYDENCGVIRIELDPRLTPSQNAQKYYKRYQKLKRTALNLTAQKRESEERLNYLKTISENIELAEDLNDLTETEQELISISLLPAPKTANGKKGGKKSEESSPFRKYLYDGFTVLCGRNNGQNDRLTKGLALTDLWLHVKTFHSSHVAVLCDLKEATDEAVKFAAEVCAYYSEARGKDKVAVDYTLKKYVKKPNGANAGFVIYTDFKTILVAPNAHTEAKCDE